MYKGCKALKLLRRLSPFVFISFQLLRILGIENSVLRALHVMVLFLILFLYHFIICTTEVLFQFVYFTSGSGHQACWYTKLCLMHKVFVTSVYSLAVRFDFLFIFILFLFSIKEYPTSLTSLHLDTVALFTQSQICC